MKWRMTDIENFVETATHPTLILAARNLGISQPALSLSLKRLEHDLGAKIFYRSRSGIQLTPTGKIFLEKAKSLILKVQELDRVSDSRAIFNGQTISIGCHTTVARYTIPKALKILEGTAPDFKVQLKHGLSRNIQALIQEGLVDIGVVVNPIRVPDLVIKKVVSDLVAVWRKSGHQVGPSVFCNLDLQQTNSILRRWKKRPDRVISTDSLELICEMVEAGLGSGILPKRVVDLSGFDLTMITTLPSFHDEICLVYRPEFGKSRAEKITIEALIEALAKP